jgi:hypothetical protein
MKKARALRTIRRLKLKADEAELSEWEGEFLDSVETRIGTYGRAFADPEKGDRESALSILQTRKLKEIDAKAQGEKAQGEKVRGEKKAQGEKEEGEPPKARKGLVRRKPFGARKRES